jgi:hypothetical protein
MTAFSVKMGLKRRHFYLKGAKIMTSIPIITWLGRFKQFGQPFSRPKQPALRPDWADYTHKLPLFVRQCPVAHRYLELLGPLPWADFPQRATHLNGYDQPMPYTAFAAACLIKLDQHLVSMGHLRRYLTDHPALLWLLGFPLVTDPNLPWRFNTDASLPTQRHFTRMLRQIPNTFFQTLLDSTVTLIKTELAELDLPLGQCIAMDTKHILAWVKENNPKTYLKSRERYDKTRQPAGDPDCRLGCKRRRNQRASTKQPPPTPPDNPVPANTISVGEYYWGYASGVVATKIPDWGEVVLAELTQPFDQPDVAYFYPLMAATERRLGFRPKFAAFDAAFDAFYIYEYFHSDQHDGFAAVPFSERGGCRRFDAHGLPLCQAGLAMPLKYTFQAKTTLFEHQRGRYVCPLLFPTQTGQSCPIQHKRWAKGGCTTTMATSIGARLRYQLDRDSDRYKSVYNQRTATERINSQAVELGIERPKIRNGQAIANINTLIYILINLRTLQRIRLRKADRRDQGKLPGSAA